MKKAEGLNPRQGRFVAALVDGATVEEAAAAAKVTERTGYNYLSDPVVKQELGKALDVLMGTATRRLAEEMPLAIESLAMIHADPEAPTSPRVSAAGRIIDACLRLKEMVDLGDRVAILEQRLQEVLNK